MKKLFLVLLHSFSFSLLIAQADFSGTWILQKEKSKMDERGAAMIQRQTLTVKQTATEVTVQVKTEQPGAEKKVDIGGEPNVYKFDGSETSATRDSPIGPIQVTCKGRKEGGQLRLITDRSFNNGANTAHAEETWTLSSDGAQLTINRQSETQRGKIEVELVYKKE